MYEWEKLRFRLYLELEVDVWFEMHVKIYYKRYIEFVCKRFEKFLIFSIDFIFVCDFWSVHTYGALGVRSKELWMTDKSYSFTCIWSCRSMFGLNWMLRYIISHFYHLSVSDLRSFWFSASILSAYMTFHRLKYVWGSGCERDRDIHTYKSYSFASILS